MIWRLHGDGGLRPGEVVAPDERLGWGKTIGLGAQHVVAMFGATFVFPVLMGLNPQLAVMMSGVSTLIFIVVTKHEVPSYLGSSAAFPGVATAIYAAGGRPSDVSGALFCVGLTLFMCGVIIHVAGSRVIGRVLPPVVTGAVVMLIGFNLAPTVARSYWPKDQWTALITMIVVVVLSVAPRGFLSRVAIFVAMVIGYALSWVEDPVLGPIGRADGTAAPRVDWSGVAAADWIGLPPVTDMTTWRYVVADDGTGGFAPTNVVGFHLPTFHLAFILLALPVVIALIAENTGHVKAVSEMTGRNLDHQMAGPSPPTAPPRCSPRSPARVRRRPTPRTSASWPRPASTRRPPTSWRPSSRSGSASARSSAPSSRPRPPASWAASASCCTA